MVFKLLLQTATFNYNAYRLKSKYQFMYIYIEKRSNLFFDNGFGEFQRGHAGLALEKKAKVSVALET